MTTKVSSIYDTLKQVASQTLPDHREHMNPYIVEANDTPSLDKGWSFFVGPAENPNQDLSCLLAVERTVTFNLTRRWFGLRDSIAERQKAEKLLLEDHLRIVKELESDPTLDEQVTSFLYTGDAGLEPIFGQGIQHILMVMSIRIRYTENLRSNI